MNGMMTLKHMYYSIKNREKHQPKEGRKKKEKEKNIQN